jgi:hypothetical protein
MIFHLNTRYVSVSYRKSKCQKFFSKGTIFSGVKVAAAQTATFPQLSNPVVLRIPPGRRVRRVGVNAPIKSAAARTAFQNRKLRLNPIKPISTTTRRGIKPAPADHFKLGNRLAGEKTQRVSNRHAKITQLTGTILLREDVHNNGCNRDHYCE